jgi:hypothetical protein
MQEPALFDQLEKRWTEGEHSDRIRKENRYSIGVDRPAPVVHLFLTAWYAGPGLVSDCPSGAVLGQLDRGRVYPNDVSLVSLLGVAVAGEKIKNYSGYSGSIVVG